MSGRGSVVNVETKDARRMQRRSMLALETIAAGVKTLIERNAPAVSLAPESPFNRTVLLLDLSPAEHTMFHFEAVPYLSHHDPSVPPVPPSPDTLYRAGVNDLTASYIITQFKDLPAALHALQWKNCIITIAGYDSVGPIWSVRHV